MQKIICFQLFVWIFRQKWSTSISYVMQSFNSFPISLLSVLNQNNRIPSATIAINASTFLACDSVLIDLKRQSVWQWRIKVQGLRFVLLVMFESFALSNRIQGVIYNYGLKLILNINQPEAKINCIPISKWRHLIAEIYPQRPQHFPRF